MTAFSLDVDAIVAAFEAAGYGDVNVGDVIVARRDEGQSQEIIIDRGGRVKATISRSGPPSEKALDINGRNAAVLTERYTIVTVMFVLQELEDLAAFLAAIEDV